MSLKCLSGLLNIKRRVRWCGGENPSNLESASRGASDGSRILPRAAERWWCSRMTGGPNWQLVLANRDADPTLFPGKIRVIIAAATPARGPGHSEPSTVSRPKSRSLPRCCVVAAKLAKRERWPQVTPGCRPRQILQPNPEKVIDPR